jgi:hypothetical protein
MKNIGETFLQNAYCSLPKHYDLFSGCDCEVRVLLC